MSQGYSRAATDRHVKRLDLGRTGELNPQQLLKNAMVLILLASLLPATAYAMCGSVSDKDGAPVSGALVRVQNTKTHSVSNLSGKFCLENYNHRKNALTAWAPGFYIGGIEPDKPGRDIVLRRLPKKDHAAYQWKASVSHQLQGEVSETEPCQQCHSQLTDEWAGDVHGSSNNNPLFKKIFLGQSSQNGQAERPGFMKDFPGAKNSCKSCHQPVADNRAIECDFCHKVKTIDTSPSLLLGRERMHFLRPEGQELFMGSLDDVYLRDDSFNPLYQSSDYCASCHQGRFWNTDVYSDYQEWLDSPYSAEGVQCQDCHMRNEYRVFSADKEKGGLNRHKDSLANHDFRITDEVLKKSVELAVAFERREGKIIVDVAVKNIAAGHHIPGGSPLRHMVMLVDVQDANDEVLPQLSGPVLPGWMTREGEFRARQPGKVFAKLLKDAVNYSSAARRKQNFSPLFPAPFWRPTLLHEDSRIPARSQVDTRFLFDAKGGPVSVTVKLYYRNIFKHWLNAADSQFRQLLLTGYSMKETNDE